MAQIKTVKADLRGKYLRYMEVSTIVSLLILIAAFKFAPPQFKNDNIKENKQEIIIVENVLNTQQETPKPTIPKPPVPILSMTDDIEDIPFQETVLSNDDVADLPQAPVRDNKIIEDEEIIFKVVEEYPQLVGGIKSLQEKLYYTEIAKRVGIEGKVLISAVIDKNGNVIEAEIHKSLFDDLDQVALKAVKELKFIPGKQRGKPVKVQITMTIHFKLN
jgi:protein TonB